MSINTKNYDLLIEKRNFEFSFIFMYLTSINSVRYRDFELVDVFFDCAKNYLELEIDSKKIVEIKIN
jgi:hypothetical protein